jgi:outer membrane receptor protein involved in Fe transport
VQVQAQAKAGALEEVVVAAQRREQALQEVPIALEAFSAAEMSKQGYRDLSSLAAFSPTVAVGSWCIYIHRTRSI